jgi:hypothetical protein
VPSQASSMPIPPASATRMHRRAILGAVACSAFAPALIACTSLANEQDFARLLRRPLTGSADKTLVLRDLVRYASLAASSHNTQCWTFHLQDQAIVIAPDLSRRCPIVDPDDHHLHVSLGCALVNLAHAALAAGLQANAHFDPTGSGAISVGLEPTRPAARGCR